MNQKTQCIPWMGTLVFVGILIMLLQKKQKSVGQDQ